MAVSGVLLYGPLARQLRPRPRLHRVQCPNKDEDAKSLSQEEVNDILVSSWRPSLTCAGEHWTPDSIKCPQFPSGGVFGYR